MDIRTFLAAMVEQGASDLYLAVDSPPMLRVEGVNHTLPEPVLTAPHTEALAYALIFVLSGTAVSNTGQIRYTSVFDAPGHMRVPVDQTFATNPDTPAAGLSLYRFSSGHGGLKCEACHGSTHAEFPAAHANDNIQSTRRQGHPGMLVECVACHGSQPVTVNGGPHGMHPVGAVRVDRHPDAAEEGGASACRACHGADDRGTVLSRSQADRVLDTDFGPKLSGTWRIRRCGPDGGWVRWSSRGIGGRDQSVSIAERYQATIPVPRAIRFPVELIPPEGFDPSRRETWPQVDGRLEYVGERLLFMPPCGDRQQDTVTDTIGVLLPWVRAHRDFVLSTNEAGMILGGDVRAADVAVWRRADVGDYLGELRRVPPILAVEVGGDDEAESTLRDKAHWYLARGVDVVWIVLPEARTVVVVDAQGEHRYRPGDVIPGRQSLLGLSAAVADFFVQIDGR